MIQKDNTYIEIFGWIGVACILLGYGLSSFGVIDPHSLLYIVLNIVGSFAIIIDAIKDKNYQPVALNIVWMAIAIINLLILFT
jgi:hypothetical protein